jgi:hypothetical protein
MTIEPERTFNARIVPTCFAFALIAIGALLRLVRLDAMEFKRDEVEILQLALQLLSDRPWSSGHGWPVHGIMSSNGVPNAPLFTWIVAALWAPMHDAIGAVRLIAILNVVSLYPLWRWTRRHTTEAAALITLAIVAVSPFTVSYSRKLWNPDVLVPCVLLVLWGIEWIRCDRPWRGVGMLLLASLLLGQLHQSGPIALALLPIAFGVQFLYDRRRGKPLQWRRPSRGEAAFVAIAALLTTAFWLPYLLFLWRQPAGLLASRPTLAAVVPDLLVRVEAQIVPVDLLSSFAPHRDDFFRDPIRAGSYYASVVLGAPLLAYGLWRWLRAPLTISVIGLWWWLIIGAFALARIPSHPFYVITLTPLVAILPAGGFDPPWLRPRLAQLLVGWRVAYVVALFGLTVTTGSWLIRRGGASGDYGVAYFHRLAQADAIASRDIGVLVRPPTFACSLPPIELRWLIEQTTSGRSAERPLPYVCEAWVDRDGGLVYEWVVKR